VASGPGENLPQDANWTRQLAREYGVLDLLASSAPVPVIRPAAEVTHGSPDDAERQARTTGAQVIENMTAAIRSLGPAIAETAWLDADPIQTLARYTELLARSARQ
jgi:hypothetical protein